MPLPNMSHLLKAVLFALCGLLTVSSAASQTMDASTMLKQTFSLLTKDQLSLLESAMDEDACINFSNQHDVAMWHDQYHNNSLFRDVLQSQRERAVAACANVTSAACRADCEVYNDVMGWIPIVVSGNKTNEAKLLPYITYYAMGAGLFAYYDAGNPDMCDFVGGTYCFTPSITAGYIINQHGCCLPGSCSGQDAYTVLHANEFCYQPFASKLENTSTPVVDRCEPMPREMHKAGPMIVILIFVLFVFLVVIASACKQYALESDAKQMNLNNAAAAVMHAVPAEAAVSSAPNLFVACFNIQDIWKSFRSVRAPGKTEYNFLDGMRVLSMSWVILGHSYLFWLTAGSSNAAVLIPGNPPLANYHYVLQNAYMMFVEYAFYSVDSFFFLSGLLATFSIWRSLQKYSGSQALRSCYAWIPLTYLTRILRIVPMMMFVTAIQWQISDQLPGGYHVTTRDQYNGYCSHDWYKILFFYANLLIESDQAIACMVHLWYIQCDMQMFLLLPWIMLQFSCNKIAGICASVVPIIICIVIRIYYGFYYRFSANFFYPSYAPTEHGGNQSQDSYYVPWTRMSVYFTGVALMLIMITIDERMKTKQSKRFQLSKTAYFGTMMLSGFILLSLVLWPWDDVKDVSDRWGVASNSWYYALSRPAWGFGLAFMTFALRYRDGTDGSKSLVKSFLSLEIYQALGKVTYLMYLLHLLMFSWWALDLEQPAYYTSWNEILLVVTIWVLTLCTAIVLWFFMEKPISNLVTEFLKSITGANKKKKEEYYEAVRNCGDLSKEQFTMDSARQEDRLHYGQMQVDEDKSAAFRQEVSFGESQKLIQSAC